MAGEAQQSITTYNDISSGKVVNKEGLLELCYQIKASIASAGGGSGGASYTAGNGIEIDANNVISTNDVVLPDFVASNTSWTPNLGKNIGPIMSEDFITSLNDLVFNYNLDVFKKRWQIGHGAYIVKLISSPFNDWYNGSVAQNYSLLVNSTRLVITHTQIGLNYIYTIDLANIYNFNTNGSGNWEYNHSTHTLSQYAGHLWNLLYTSNTDYYPADQTTRNNLSGKDVVCGRHYNSYQSIIPQYYTLSTVGQTGSYNDLTDKPTIPKLPIDPSNDGSYVLQNTVSSGASTLSWGTPSSGGGSGTNLPIDPSSDGSYVLQNTISSGSSTLSWTTPSSGGTTYTAGTGISITNGVISLDLANASQEVM